MLVCARLIYNSFAKLQMNCKWVVRDCGLSPTNVRSTSTDMTELTHHSLDYIVRHTQVTWIMRHRAHVCGNHCMCNGENGDVPWSDFRPSADWVHTTFTRECDAPPIDSALVQPDSMYGRMAIYSDWMHDRYLGTCKVLPHTMCTVCIYREHAHTTRTWSHMTCFCFGWCCSILRVCIYRIPVHSLPISI